ncbi:hypothetical protein NM688_g1206 [Phlebia brevispora]|uniref:Uncharacterized protein n=1 Tax=Phlebia brevispora TaxID=194682 RepID=A0ACC1TCE5_9APHY|nr:hypothetical protein NM688_g1206 [Phlebia brevispora]
MDHPVWQFVLSHELVADRRCVYAWKICVHVQTFIDGTTRCTASLASTSLPLEFRTRFPRLSARIFSREQKAQRAPYNLSISCHSRRTQYFTAAMDTDCDAFFTQDTDISGIGVRVAFYLQSIILLMLVSLAPEEAPGVFWTLTSMVSGLMIVACISAVNGSLSFYNANIVSTYRTVESLQNIPPSASRETCRTALSDGDILPNPNAIRGDYDDLSVVSIMAAAYHFGPNPECIPLIKFYFMFWRVHFKFETIRVLALVYYIGIATVMTFIFVGETLGERKINLKRQTFFRSFWFYVLTAIVNIAPLELFLKQYHQDNSAISQWTFGQILALIAVLPPITSFIFSLGEALFKEPKPRRAAHARSVTPAAQAGTDRSAVEDGVDNPASTALTETPADLALTEKLDSNKGGGDVEGQLSEHVTIEEHKSEMAGDGGD